MLPMFCYTTKSVTHSTEDLAQLTEMPEINTHQKHDMEKKKEKKEMHESQQVRDWRRGLTGETEGVMLTFKESYIRSH